MSSNGSHFTSGNPNSPDPNGTQVAFLQGNGSISQTVTLAAGCYTFPSRPPNAPISQPERGIEVLSTTPQSA